MMCRLVRRQLTSYLLEELSGAQRVRVQDHLDRCPDCARACESLANHLDDLEEALTAGIRTPPDLQERLEDRIRQAVPAVPWVRRRSRRRRILPPLATAGALLLALCMARSWVWLDRSHAPGVRIVGPGRTAVTPSPRSRPTEIRLAALVTDHVEYLAKPSPAEFATRDARAVAVYLSRRLGYPVAAVDLSSEGATLLGGRKCELEGVPVAFLFYDRRGTRLSLYQLDTRLARLPALAPIRFRGRDYRVGRRGPVNLVAWQSGRMTFVIVSDMERQALLRVADCAAA